MPTTVEVTFQAQEWDNDYAQPAERTPNRVKFTIPYEDALIDGEIPADDTHKSDELALHTNAPDWVNNWVENSEGPFYVQTEVIE